MSTGFFLLVFERISTRKRAVVVLDHDLVLEQIRSCINTWKKAGLHGGKKPTEPSPKKPTHREALKEFGLVSIQIPPVITIIIPHIHNYYVNYSTILVALGIHTCTTLGVNITCGCTYRINHHILISSVEAILCLVA